MDQYILGVDIGTTSVKVCIVNTKTSEVVAHQAKDTQSNIPSDVGSSGNEQDVSTIISALNLCVSKLPKQQLQDISKIGVCGQMHGVMLWNNDGERAWDMVEKDKSVRYDVVQNRVSTLYTWQDNRCDPCFLASTPKPQSHLTLASGFGTATIFWLVKNKPEILEKYNCSGTIHDFAVAMLCNLDKPIMSPQNAASWGYFDCTNYKWNCDILENAGFPISLLPEVKQSSEMAGFLAENWHSIPKGTPIGVALGDLQCSVLSTVETPEDAILNISTSAQICFVAKDYSPNSGPPEVSPVQYFPYFKNQFIAVAASLNAKVWEKVIALSSECSAVSDLEIKPTCLGERHAPDLAASVQNIHVGNLQLGQVFRAICRGLIENIHSMMPREILQNAKINRIVGNGSGLSRNPVLQKEVQQLYQLPLVFTKGGDAAKGAALAVALD
ncbi:hypothetical protein NQ314_014431 [Rhamnusium bicolor]|uniref:Carbohydrate kinase FGGY N-terminal domain-containing protein n=1 Tax=Rhamnusium bicolor TaxID=1586634 RepID=A0AAV8X1P3_9CUCU|nr:hypothetical protein NQ314_014431 [Rhamnusium bicolor]